MNKIVILMPVMLCMVLFFNGCDNSSGESSDAVSDPKSHLYGSYWGTLPFGTWGDLEMCLDVRKDQIYFLGTMCVKYSVVEYTQADDGTWSFATYKANDPEPRCEGTFTVNGSEITCVAVIHPMGDATSNTLTLGDNYDGRFDTIDMLYGSYWGTFDYGGTSYNICIVYTESGISFYTNGVWSGTYAASYTQDPDSKIWSYTGSSDGNVILTGSFGVNGAERTTVAAIASLSATGTLTMGDDYDGEFD